jgi:hypothetical protein
MNDHGRGTGFRSPVSQEFTRHEPCAQLLTEFADDAWRAEHGLARNATEMWAVLEQRYAVEIGTAYAASETRTG